MSTYEPPVYGPPPYSSRLGANSARGGYGPLASGYGFQPAENHDGPYAGGYRGGTTAPSAPKESASVAVPVGGALNALSQMAAGYYQALSRKSELRQLGQSLDFEAFVSKQNARAAEMDAMSVLEAGQQEIGRYTLQAGQDRAALATSMAAGGIKTNVGSAAEVLASLDLRKEIDTMTIRSNAARRAAALRLRAQDERNAAAIARGSANTARSMARGVDQYAPIISGAASLLGTASSVS